MFALDLFNNDHERRLAEGAVDTLEQRRIDDLAMKMDDLVARAKNPAYKKNPAALAALMKEFQKCKAERDSYFKVRTETMGYSGLTAEAGIPGNVPTEKIPGKEDLLKGRGRSYYENQLGKKRQSIDEFDASGYNRYSIYLDDYDLKEKFADIDDAVDAIKAYKRDDPKSQYADYNVRDLNGKVVWRNDAWQDIQKPGKIQFLKPKTNTSEATGDDKFDSMMDKISADPWTQLNSDPNWEYEIEELVDQHIEPWLLAMEKSGMPITRDEETLNPGWRKRYEQVANQLAQKYLASKKLNPRDPDLLGKIRYAIDWHTDESRNVHGQLSAYSDLPMQRYADAFDADGMTANIRDALAGVGSGDEDEDRKKNSEITEDQRLAVGDPIIVTAPNEFEGKTGEIYEFSPSGRFVIVDLYNHGKHSMHLSDVEYNQYADDQAEEDDWYDDQEDTLEEAAVNPQFIVAQVTKLLATEARRITNAPMAQLLAPVMKEYGLTLQQIDAMYPGGLKRAAGEYGIMMKEEQLNEFLPVLAAIGRGLATGAMRIGANMMTGDEVDEGFQDFNKVEPYAVCLAGKPVKRFDYYEQARRFHDNWKQKLYREGNKAKADKITLMPLNLDEGARGDAIKQGYQAAVKGLTKQQNPYYKSVNGQTPPEAYDWEAGWEDARDSGKIPQGVAEDVSRLSDSEYNRVAAYVRKKYPGTQLSGLGRNPDGSFNVMIDTGSGRHEFKVRFREPEETGIDEGDDLTHAGQDVMVWLGPPTNNPPRDDKKYWIRGKLDSTEMHNGSMRANVMTAKGMYNPELSRVFKAEQGVTEAETDYQKRRQRERDVDAGKPVAKQRQSKMTDYQKRRAQDKKDMELGEDQDTSGVESAIIRRIMVAHTDLLMKFGPEKVMQAAEEVAYNVGDVDEIGTSDVSAYVAQVKQILGAVSESKLEEKWTAKYKSSINCANPKGFSQKAHCAGRKNERPTKSY